MCSEISGDWLPSWAREEEPAEADTSGYARQSAEAGIWGAARLPVKFFYFSDEWDLIALDETVTIGEPVREEFSPEPLYARAPRVHVVRDDIYGAEARARQFLFAIETDLAAVVRPIEARARDSVLS